MFVCCALLLAIPGNLLFDGDQMILTWVINANYRMISVVQQVPRKFINDLSRGISSMQLIINKILYEEYYKNKRKKKYKKCKNNDRHAKTHIYNNTKQKRGRLFIWSRISNYKSKNIQIYKNNINIITKIIWQFRNSIILYVNCYLTKVIKSQ